MKEGHPHFSAKDNINLHKSQISLSAKMLSERVESKLYVVREHLHSVTAEVRSCYENFCKSAYGAADEIRRHRAGEFLKKF